MTDSPRRRVALIGTGGTISSIGRDSLDVWEYMDTARKAEPTSALQRVPQVASRGDRPRQLPSGGEHCHRPRRVAAAGHRGARHAGAAAPLDGVVIAHGTATLAETAYFLNLPPRRPPRGGGGCAAARHGPQLRRRHEPPERAARGRLAGEARAGRPRRPQRRDPGRPRGDKASTLRLETFRSQDSACSATRIPTAASPSTGAPRAATPPTPSST